MNWSSFAPEHGRTGEFIIQNRATFVPNYGSKQISTDRKAALPLPDRGERSFDLNQGGTIRRRIFDTRCASELQFCWGLASYVLRRQLQQRNTLASASHVALKRGHVGARLSERRSAKPEHRIGSGLFPTGLRLVPPLATTNTAMTVRPGLLAVRPATLRRHQRVQIHPSKLSDLKAPTPPLQPITMRGGADP
jgi:hypothetical protein